MDDVFNQLAELPIWLPHGKKKAPQYINDQGLFTGLDWDKSEHWMTRDRALEIVEANPALLTGIGLMIDQSTVIDGMRLIAIDVDLITGYSKAVGADPDKGIEAVPAVTFDPVTDAEKVRGIVTLIDQIDSYWEASPSHTGVHTIVWAPEAWAAKYGNTGKFYPGGCDHSEFYSGEAPTYITVTGVGLGVCNPLGVLSDAVQAQLAPLLKPAGGKATAADLELDEGDAFELRGLSCFNAEQRDMLDGKIPKGKRSDVMYGLLIALIDAPQVYLLNDIRASVLSNPALLEYFSKHNDAAKFASEEINRAYAKSSRAKRDALIGFSEKWKPVSASTAPPFEQKPAPGVTGRHGFEAPYLDALWDDNLAIDWMIYGVLENKVIAELWGPAGAYKSFTAFDMAVAIASGQDWHKHKVMRQGPVLYVPGEGGRRNIIRRLRVVCQERGLGRDQKIRISNMPVLLSKVEQYEFPLFLI